MRGLMRIPFVKMHGLGNDFVVLDGRTVALPPITSAVVTRLSDRHTGIGCDQLIVLEADDAADFRMRIFNSDGSEVGACGNASRAVALLHGAPARIATGGGLVEVAPGDAGARVNMGMPRFEWDAVPLAYPLDTASVLAAWEGLTDGTAVNVGNPHIVFFVGDADAIDLGQIGPVVEHDPLFPQRINVNVASIHDGQIALRVWERGAGLTLACGTGACATAVAAIRRKLVQSPVTVTLPGGALQIEWNGGDSPIIMSGPAAESYRGTFAWEDYA